MTGNAGLFGSQLCRSLVTAEMDVVCVTNCYIKHAEAIAQGLACVDDVAVFFSSGGGGTHGG